MESLVRVFICFTLIYLASCKVLRQQGEHAEEISGIEVTHGRMNESIHPSELNETSVKQTNESRSINFLEHVPEMNQPDGRSLPALPGVTRSLKRMLFAWTYYGPEVGLSGCLFRYAWFNYPVVPEMSHAMMSRASRMINGFMSDFWSGYRDRNHNTPEYRISNKVQAMTEEDYHEYRTQQVLQNLGPFRRVGDVENAPLVEKFDPKVASVAEMLKHLQPKANATQSATRLGRQLKLPPQLPNNVHRFRTISGDGRNVRYFIINRHDDGRLSSGNATKPAIRRTNYDSADGGRAQRLVQQPLGPFKMDRLGFDAAEKLGPPDGLPSFNELPPADYTYFEDGVYHHVHDLRHGKGSHGDESYFDFEDWVLQALGLTQARSAPTIGRCSTHYLLGAVLRFFQTSFLG